MQLRPGNDNFSCAPSHRVRFRPDLIVGFSYRTRLNVLPSLANTRLDGSRALAGECPRNSPARSEPVHRVMFPKGCEHGIAVRRVAGFEHYLQTRGLNAWRREQAMVGHFDDVGSGLSDAG
jgi:hypothetical protein